MHPPKAEESGRLIMRYASLAATIVCLTAMLSANAAAEIWRGCRANVQVRVSGGDYASVASIEGRGSCKNVFHKKDCRERARDAITYCANDIWAHRGHNGIPSGCLRYSGTSRP